MQSPLGKLNAHVHQMRASTVIQITHQATCIALPGFSLEGKTGKIPSPKLSFGGWHHTQNKYTSVGFLYL